MRSELPSDCGLSEKVRSISGLMPYVGGQPSITDVQYDALAAGVAMGKSLLISAPTSTGKTLIGWWAIASAVEAGRRAVYLVSHRALAKQKFEEAQQLFLESYLEGDRAAIVCATGDAVENGFGQKTTAPLSASILIATYEKFLACLSTGGPPRDLTDITFICDEVQLIGDKTRGQNTELLLTLLKNAGWGQFVSLSAVLANKDAQSFSDWLSLKLVRNPKREKALRIQCRTSANIHEVVAAPGVEGVMTKREGKLELSINAIVTELHKTPDRKPTIVFCMKVDDTYDLAQAWIQGKSKIKQIDPPPGLDIDGNLAKCLERGAAFHNAELSEDERLFVEERLRAGDVDVVYATSTLAAGVNFPFGAAVFSSWKRWAAEKKAYVPIDRAEFQNMAGRVGRMGQTASEGVVILSAESATDATAAVALMDMQRQEKLGHGIKPDDFSGLALQIFAGKLCYSRDEAFALLSSTLSASREVETNVAGIAHWKARLDVQIDRLILAECIIETRGRISVTEFGVAIAASGIKPETAIYMLKGLVAHAQQLSELLSSEENPDAENDLLFILAHAALRPCHKITALFPDLRGRMV